MLELYIAGFKADINEESTIPFTYKSIDITNPTAIKNSFSTTIKLPGTPNNNKIFGQIWNIPTTVYLSNNSTIYASFDPNKRVDFELVSDGTIIESGYMQMTNIVYNKSGSYVYEITLYGGLGDFFYNLMYDEGGENKTLYNLYYGWNNLGKESEESERLFTFNKNYIKMSWDMIMGVTASQDTIYGDVTAIPTYHGLNEDFENNKCIVEIPSSTSPERGLWFSSHPIFPLSLSDGTTNYTPYRNHVLVEMNRDLVEWEARDIRSSQQRIGLRFGKFLETIANPENNGGYELDYSHLPDIYKGEDGEFKYTAWIMLNKPAWDEYSDASEQIIINENTGIQAYGTFTKQLINSEDDSEIFDTTEYPRAGININVAIGRVMGLPVSDGNIYPDCNTNRYDTNGNKIGNYAFCGRYDYYDENDNYIQSSRVTFAHPNNFTWYNQNFFTLATTCNRYNALKANGNFKFASNKFNETNHIQIIKDTDANKFMVLYNVEDFYNVPLGRFKAKLTLWLVYVPNVGAISVTTNLFFSFGTRTVLDSTLWGYNNVNAFLTTPATSTVCDYNNAVINTETLDNKASRNIATKKILFGNSKSPYEYLVDFTKQLNLKYEYDKKNKKITILLPSEYYSDITPNKLIVDKLRDISIRPTLSEYKYYNWGLEQPETYASILYNKRYTVPYGAHSIDTGYEFNIETNDMFENNIYKSIIPYQLKSSYFNIHNEYSNTYFLPSIVQSPTYKYTLYSSAVDFDSPYEVILSTNQQSGISNTSLTKMTTDSIMRLCCFDIENNNVSDCENALVFLTPKDYMVEQYNNIPMLPDYGISDDLDIMWDMAGGACYLWTSQISSEAIHTKYVPQFTNYYCTQANKDNYFADHCLLFDNTNMLFTNNGNMLCGNRQQTAYNTFADNTFLYPLSWKNLYEDIYSLNSREMTCYAFLHGNGQDLLKKIWYYDGCYWILTEINNFVAYDNNSTKCKLIKIKDPSNLQKNL